MGVQEATKFGAIGFIADRLLNTGFLATAAGAAYGHLFRPDAGEMNEAYDKRKATVGQTLKDFFGYEMTDTLFGTAAKEGKKPEDVRPSPERAQANAKAKEKTDGFPWGKVLLGVGAAFLGVNLLDNMTMGPFSGGAYAPFGMWDQGIGVPGLGGFGGGLGGILPLALTAILGLGGRNILC